MRHNECNDLEIDRGAYGALASAIILQACMDYREAAAWLMRYPNSKGARAVVRECEAFFQSRWFADLVKVDGDRVLDQLRQKFGVERWDGLSCFSREILEKLELQGEERTDQENEEE